MVFWYSGQTYPLSGRDSYLSKLAKHRMWGKAMWSTVPSGWSRGHITDPVTLVGETEEGTSTENLIRTQAPDRPSIVAKSFITIYRPFINKETVAQVQITNKCHY